MTDETPSEEVVQLSFKVKTSNDGNHSITMPETATVLDLKTKLATTEFEDIPVDRQRLIYSGRVMKNGEKLSFYKIKDGNTIHMVKSAASNAAQNPANAGASVASQGSAAGVPTNMAAGTAVNNPLVGLTGARYAGHNINLPGLGAFGADGGMGAPPTEEQLADILSDPNAAQSMNEALNNPAVLDMIINSNPTLRQMGPQAREMLQSPLFRQMMTNPDIIRRQARMRNMMAGNQANMFPAPGVTDTTPEGAAGTNANANPSRGAGMGDANFASLLGGQGAANPFAALLQPRGQTPAQTPPPPASAGQDTPAGTAAPGSNEAQANPFASQFGAPPSGLASMMTPEAMQSALQMMQDPQFAAMMGGEAGAGGAQNPFGMSPELMRMAMEMMQDPQYASLLGGLGGEAGAGAGAGAQNPFGMSPEMMRQAMQMFGGAGAAGGGGMPPNYANLFGSMGAGSPAAPADTRPPEERYAEQLRQLNDMGFFEFDRNVEALRRSGGSVQGAIEQLLNGS